MKSELLSEVEADLKEKSQSGYKMALIDSDKLLRRVLKEKGYPGKDMRKQLFWASVNLNARPDLKKAFQKKDEILNEYEYRLSTFELEDFLNAYRKVIERVSSGDKLTLRKKIGIYFENYFFLKNTSKIKLIVGVLAVFFIIKILSSTDMGQKLTKKIVDADNFMFDWFIILLLIGLAVGVVVFLSFIYFDKSKKVKIKED